MLRVSITLTAIVLSTAIMPALPADDAVSESEVRQAVTRALPLIEAASVGSADQRECFTCHHQAVPILTLRAARDMNFDVDHGNLERQIQHTITHLQRGYEDYVVAKGQGGQALTAGYALWALRDADWTPDETTSAVAHYLVERQRQEPQWHQSSNRPPSSGSDFAVTYVALQGLSAYGSGEDRSTIRDRRSAVADWLEQAPAVDTEDHVFRLLALQEVHADSESVDAAARQLASLQRESGGWAQLPDLEPDAYATGTALYALLTVEQTAVEPAVIARGIRWLLDQQHDDGSWHVVTRADGFQTYFESGFPWYEDQFISMAASSWATLALVASLPESSPVTQDTAVGEPSATDLSLNQNFTAP